MEAGRVGSAGRAGKADVSWKWCRLVRGCKGAREKYAVGEVGGGAEQKWRLSGSTGSTSVFP
eukprot:1857722-Pleurochrysis_carterae.AAC.1